MNRPLSPNERVIRMHIRNCYLVADQQELENEIERRIDREDFLAVRFLRELKDELDGSVESCSRAMGYQPSRS